MQSNPEELQTVESNSILLLSKIITRFKAAMGSDQGIDAISVPYGHATFINPAVDGPMYLSRTYYASDAWHCLLSKATITPNPGSSTVEVAYTGAGHPVALSYDTVTQKSTMSNGSPLTVYAAQESADVAGDLASKLGITFEDN